MTFISWSEVAVISSPGDLRFHGMAFDHTRGVTVLFGGEAEGSGAAKSGTWTFDGTDWTHLSPSTTPPARVQQAMAWHGGTGKVVMFGGGGFDYYPGPSLNDTWTWDGTDWTEESPGTSPDAYASDSYPGLNGAMAYDATNDKCVLFSPNADGTTWTWDGTDWTQESPTHNPAVTNPYAMMLAWDTANNCVVLYGTGNIGHATWTWDGTDWTHHFPDPYPPDRVGAGMDYDTNLGKIVLFGGFTLSPSTVFLDTWSWNGSAWTEESPAASPAARSTVLVGDPVRNNSMIYGGYHLTSGAFHDTVVLDPAPPPPLIVFGGASHRAEQ